MNIFYENAPCLSKVVINLVQNSSRNNNGMIVVTKVHIVEEIVLSPVLHRSPLQKHMNTGDRLFS